MAEFGANDPLASSALSFGLDDPVVGEKPKKATVGDYARGALTGFVGDTAKGLGYLLESAGVDYGRRMRDAGSWFEEEQKQQMTPGGRRAAESSVFEGDGITDLRPSDNWGQALGMGAARSLPQMVQMVLPGRAAATGLSAIPALTRAAEAVRAGGASLGTRALAAAPSAIGYGAAEGLQAGSINAADIQTELEAKGIDPATAAKAASDVFLRTAVSTGGIGMATGGGALGMFDRLTRGVGRRGMARAVGEGAVKEAGQEFLQSGGEAYIENLARRDYVDPALDPWRGVPAQAASGAAIGGVTGAAFGGAGHAVTPRDQLLSDTANIVKKHLALPPPTYEAGSGPSIESQVAREQDITEADRHAQSVYAARDAEEARRDAALAAAPVLQRPLGTPKDLPLADPKGIFEAITAKPGIFQTIEKATAALPEPKAEEVDTRPDVAAALKELQADPQQIFRIQKEQPEVYATIAKMAGELDKVSAERRTYPREREALQALVAKGELTDEDLAYLTQSRFAKASGDALMPLPAARRRLKELVALQGDGTRAAPVHVSTSADIEAATEVAKKDYTPPQGEANNVQRAHVDWNGLEGTLEVPAGGVRRGTVPDTGEEWSTTHTRPYGYWKGTKGGDGMHVDTIWGPDVEGGHPVYVIDEIDDSGKWRQHKTLPGFPSEQAAREAYLGISSKKPEHIGAITAMPVEQFREWVKDEAQTTKPLSYQPNAAPLAPQTTVATTAEPEAAPQVPATPPRDGASASPAIEQPAAGAESARPSDGEAEARPEVPAEESGEVDADENAGQAPLGNDARADQSLGEAPKKSTAADQASAQQNATAVSADASRDRTGVLDQLTGETVTPQPLSESKNQQGLFTETRGSPEYQAVNEETRQATAKFRKAQEDYRSRRIGDDEFLAARAEHDAAQARFDEAFAKEKKRKSSTAAGRPSGDVSAEAATAADQALRAKSHDKANPGDVRLMTNKYVSLEDALAATREAIANGVRPVPFQIVDKVGIAFSDVDRVLAAVKSGDDTSAAAPNPEQRSSPRVAESQAPESESGDAGVAPGRETALPDNPMAAAAEALRNAADAIERSVAPKTGIADFGKKIEGARKDAMQAYRDKLAEANELDIATVPLSQSWPEPDYQKLLDDGADSFAVAFAHAARDEVPTKPQSSWKLKGWVTKVTLLRDTMNKLMAGNIDANRARELLDAMESLRDVRDRAHLYIQVGHEKSLKGIRLTQGSYGVFEGVSYSPPKIIWSVEGKAKSTTFSRWPTMYAKGDTREEAIENFKRVWSNTPATQEAEKRVEFNIYGRRRENTFFIGKKIGPNVIELKGGFATAKEARQWKADNQAELESLLAKFKDVPSERRATNDPRVGEDHRNGADITPERFAETFGFRGGQFGNTMAQAERQVHLNETYDALMDLAGVLGVPPKALSLNGELGLAFGARGTGGINAAAAHYEPDTTGAVTDDRVVINLTRKRGAGSLAHEWWHAVDNYFARMRGSKGAYLTEAANAGGEGVRPEMLGAFKRVVASIEAGAIKARSRKLDQTRTKAYWSTGREMAARAFESYIVAKLQDQSASNDYLANIVSEDYWNAAAALGMEKEDTYPYPTAAEIPAIRAGFDEFFKTVQTRETESSIAMYSPSEAYNPNQLDFVYDDAETRPGTTDEQRSTGIAALRGLLRRDRRAGATLLGSAIWRNFSEGKGSDLIGAQARTHEELATLAQVLRDPRFETLRIFYTKNGQIVGHTGTTSRLPGIVAFVTTTKRRSQLKTMDEVDAWEREAANATWQRFREIWETKQRLGADSYWLLHNHPSGKSTPSQADVSLTRQFAEAVPGFKGHIVIDHDEYSTIDEDGRTAPHAINNTRDTTPELPHDVLGDSVMAPYELMLVAKRLQAKSGYSVLVSTDARGRVSAIAEVPSALLEGETETAKLKAMARVRRFGRMTASTNRVFVVAENPRALHYLIRNGVAEDVASFEGASSRSLDGTLSPQSENKPKPGILHAEQDNAMFRRGPSSGIDKSAVENEVTSLAEGWANKPKLVITQTPEEWGIGAPDDAKGAHWRGTTYLAASAHVDANESRETFFHESWHFAVWKMGKAIEPELNHLWAVNPKVKRGTAEWIANNKDVIKKQGLNPVQAKLRGIDEALAQMAQSGEKINGLQRVIAAIQKWLRSHGMDNLATWLEERTDAEALSLIAEARKFLEQGEQTPHVLAGVPAMARRIWRGTQTIRDFIVPETAQYDGNMTGDLAVFPDDVRGAEALPIRLPVGIVRGAHRGFGVLHLKDNADRDGSRHPPKITDDEAENLVQDVAKVALSAQELYEEGERLAFRSSAERKALILERAFDMDGEPYYAVVSLVPSMRSVWGDSVWRGRANLPTNEPQQLGAPTDSQSSSATTGPYTAGNQTEHYDINRQRPKPLVTVKKRRTIDSDDGPASPDIAFSRSAASWNAPEPSKMDNVLYTLQDKHVDTKRVLEAIRKTGKDIADAQNVYLQEELYHGRSAKRVQDFINDELKPLLTEMRMRGVAMADFEKYLWARHAEERNAQIAKVNPDMPDGGSGMTNAEAQEYLGGLNAKDRRAYEALAVRIDGINAGTRQTIVDYGLEAPETIKAWQSAYKAYVPLYRDDDAPGIGQGYSVKGPASKRAMGSEKAVVDILANIAMQRERAIVRGEKNRVANALVGLATANPNEDFWTVDKPPMLRYIDPRTGLVAETVDPTYKTHENVVMSRTIEDGKVIEHSVVFNESDERALRMARALKNLDIDNLGTILGASAKVTRYFASVNTQYNPIFGVVNLTRDTQGSLVNLSSTPLRGKQADVLKNTLSALRGIYIDLRDVRAGKEPSSSWAQLFEEFQAEGGQTAYRDLFRTSKERGEAIEREFKRVTEGKVKQFGRAVFDWLSDYNAAMENAVRLSTYKVAKDNGLSSQQAASLAKNISVNFNRKGEITTQASALYVFFNASVQGTARLSETLRGPAGKKIIIGGITLGAVQALALAAAGFDDEEPPDFVRQRNLIIPIGDGKYLTVPMPLGLHFLPNLGRVPMEFALSGFRSPGKRVADLFGVFIDAFNPVGGGGSVLQAVAPTIADPLAALAENKDWTGKPIARQDFGLNVTPGHTRAKDTATEFGKVVSKGLNWISGGTNYKPGLFSPTPDQLDYLAGQITGGIGREIGKANQAISSTFTGEELPSHKIPLLGRFYGETQESSAQANRFYSNLKTMSEHEAEIKGRMAAKESVSDYLEENPEARLYRRANLHELEVSKLRKRKRELMEKDAPREQIKAIEERITASMKRFNDAVRLVREKEAA